MNQEPQVSIIPAIDQSEALAQVQAQSATPESKLVEPDWVISYHARPKGHWLRWLTVLVQWLTGCLVAWIFIMIPLDPTISPFHNWKNPVIIVMLICFIGKTLIDTLFYDHYQP